MYDNNLNEGQIPLVTSSIVNTNLSRKELKDKAFNMVMGIDNSNINEFNPESSKHNRLLNKFYTKYSNQVKDSKINFNKLYSLFKTYYNNIRPYISNSLDESNASNFSEAYKNARSKGAKTFIYNGGYYNTNYSGKYHKLYEDALKSGEVYQFEKEHPDLIHPLLYRAKNEELQTYGITNETTHDKNIIERRLHNNLHPQGYEDYIKRVFNTVILNKKEDPATDYYNNQIRLDDTMNQRYDLFDLSLGFPARNRTIGISKYKPKISKKQLKYYFNLRGLADKFTYSNDPYHRPNYGVSLGQEEKRPLGHYTISHQPGYISYYDKWDINPTPIPNVNFFPNTIELYDRGSEKYKYDPRLDFHNDMYDDEYHWNYIKSIENGK